MDHRQTGWIGLLDDKGNLLAPRRVIDFEQDDRGLTLYNVSKIKFGPFDSKATAYYWDLTLSAEGHRSMIGSLACPVEPFSGDTIEFLPHAISVAFDTKVMANAVFRYEPTEEDARTVWDSRKPISYGYGTSGLSYDRDRGPLFGGPTAVPSWTSAYERDRACYGPGPWTSVTDMNRELGYDGYNPPATPKRQKTLAERLQDVFWKPVDEDEIREALEDDDY